MTTTLDPGILREIRNRRDAGRVTAAYMSVGALPREPIHLLLDSFAERLDFRGLGDGWAAVNRVEAGLIVGKVLARDLAHDSEIMSEEDAASLADGFLDLFEGDALFFTNWIGSTWQPISDSTFDSGILGVDSRHIGILWVEDED